MNPIIIMLIPTRFLLDLMNKQGWWVGIATHVGDALTYKILTKHNKVIYRSAIWSALDLAKRNHSVFLHLVGRFHPITLEIKFLFDHLNVQMILNWMVIQVSNNAWLPLDPKDLIGTDVFKRL